LLAVGTRELPGMPRELTPYTHDLLDFLLDPNVLHSVSDENTKKLLENSGFTNVINTSCVTMWGLTPDRCLSIPTKKNVDALTTLTDYAKDEASDRLMLNTLLNNYEHVYLWVQSLNDSAYADYLVGENRLNFINHPKDSLDTFLSSHAQSIDYFGTRLHAGIHCLNHGIRSRIVIVDNRAESISKDTNIPVIQRSSLSDSMEETIYNNEPTKITLPSKSIQQWINQFE
jgi:hypothetical protein